MKRLIVGLLFTSTCVLSANAADSVFLDGKNSFGVGVYNENVLYWNRNGASNNHEAEFVGWVAKYTRNFNSYHQLSALYFDSKGGPHYLNGYKITYQVGYNLDKNGLGIYTGLSYANKTIVELGADRKLNKKMRDSYEIPIGIQVQNDDAILSLDIVIDSNNMSTDELGIDNITPPITITYSIKF
ncbi:MAG: hypothetical protein HRU38_11160 [Saccharospirillaceae bacterium]|nr:hypothetical protein [Pseudomonadales bacterium]NRB79212.1 hypothetical protein [Saccharospirillaceae bacterium]